MNITPEATMEITESEYKRLIRDSLKLSYLEAGGVDNWQWYDDSLEPYWKMLDEDDV